MRVFFCISERVHLVWSVSTSKFVPARRFLDPLQDITIQHRIPIHLSFIALLPVVSDAVFFSVSPSLTTVRFGSSRQLINHGFGFAMMVEQAVGRGRRSEASGE